MRSSHLIEQLDFDIAFEGPDAALEDQDCWPGLLQDTLLPIIDELLDRYDVADAVLVIPSLELDLGRIQRAGFEHDLAHRLRLELDDQLARILQRVAGEIAGEEHEGSPPVLRSTADADLDDLSLFLRTGRLPWHADQPGRDAHVAQLDGMMREHQDALAAALPALLADEAAVRRLVAQYPERQLSQLLHLRAGDHAQASRALIDRWRARMSASSLSDAARAGVIEFCWRELFGVFGQRSAAMNVAQVDEAMFACARQAGWVPDAAPNFAPKGGTEARTAALASVAGATPWAVESGALAWGTADEMVSAARQQRARPSPSAQTLPPGAEDDLTRLVRYLEAGEAALPQGGLTPAALFQRLLSVAPHAIWSILVRAVNERDILEQLVTLPPWMLTQAVMQAAPSDKAALALVPCRIAAAGEGGCFFGVSAAEIARLSWLRTLGACAAQTCINPAALHARITAELAVGRGRASADGADEIEPRRRWQRMQTRAHAIGSEEHARDSHPGAGHIPGAMLAWSAHAPRRSMSGGRAESIRPATAGSEPEHGSDDEAGSAGRRPAAQSADLKNGLAGHFVTSRAVRTVMITGAARTPSRSGATPSFNGMDVDHAHVSAGPQAQAHSASKSGSGAADRRQRGPSADVDISLARLSLYLQTGQLTFEGRHTSAEIIFERALLSARGRLWPNILAALGDAASMERLARLPQWLLTGMVLMAAPARAAELAQVAPEVTSPGMSARFTGVSPARVLRLCWLRILAACAGEQYNAMAVTARIVAELELEHESVCAEAPHAHTRVNIAAVRERWRWRPYRQVSTHADGDGLDQPLNMAAIPADTDPATLARLLREPQGKLWTALVRALQHADGMEHVLDHYPESVLRSIVQAWAPHNADRIFASLEATGGGAQQRRGHWRHVLAALGANSEPAMSSAESDSQGQGAAAATRQYARDADLPLQDGSDAAVGERGGRQATASKKSALVIAKWNDCIPEQATRRALRQLQAALAGEAGLVQNLHFACHSLSDSRVRAALANADAGRSTFAVRRLLAARFASQCAELTHALAQGASPGASRGAAARVQNPPAVTSPQELAALRSEILALLAANGAIAPTDRDRLVTSVDEALAGASNKRAFMERVITTLARNEILDLEAVSTVAAPVSARAKTDAPVAFSAILARALETGDDRALVAHCDELQRREPLLLAQSLRFYARDAAIRSFLVTRFSDRMLLVLVSALQPALSKTLEAAVTLAAPLTAALGRNWRSVLWEDALASMLEPGSPVFAERVRRRIACTDHAAALLSQWAGAVCASHGTATPHPQPPLGSGTVPVTASRADANAMPGRRDTALPADSANAGRMPDRTRTGADPDLLAQLSVLAPSPRLFHKAVQSAVEQDGALDPQALLISQLARTEPHNRPALAPEPTVHALRQQVLRRLALAGQGAARLLQSIDEHTATARKPIPFLQRVLTALEEQADIDLEAIASDSGQTDRMAPTAANAAAESVNGEARPAFIYSSIPYPCSEPEIGELLELPNAGLVLAAPYVPRLFAVLGLVADGQFVNEGAAERAVHLLQYVVTGRSVTPEYELTLNKVLCGLAVSAPISSGIAITSDEEQTITGLLNAMIATWTTIGKTSIDGLRQSFLARRGEMNLSADAWQLRVTPGPFDMLLDKLPWSFSIIKYPWMAQPIHVTWR